MLLRWNVQHGSCVIPKSTKPQRIEENAGIWDWSLSKEDYDTLSSIKFQVSKPPRDDQSNLTIDKIVCCLRCGLRSILTLTLNFFSLEPGKLWSPLLNRRQIPSSFPYLTVARYSLAFQVCACQCIPWEDLHISNHTLQTKHVIVRSGRTWWAKKLHLPCLMMSEIFCRWECVMERSKALSSRDHTSQLRICGMARHDTTLHLNICQYGF